MNDNFTPLERLGLEVAAERLLCGGRGLGRLLSVLLLAQGRTVPPPTLRAAQVSPRDHEPATENTVSVRICLLRAGLADVGLPEVIKTVRGEGYSLPEPGRSKVLRALAEEAAA